MYRYIHTGRVRKVQIEAYDKQQEEANVGKSTIYFTDENNNDDDDEDDGNGNSNNDDSSKSNISSSSSCCSNINSKHTSDIENRGKPSQHPQNNNSSNSKGNGNSNSNGNCKDSSSDNSKQLKPPKPSFNHLLGMNGGGMNGGGRYVPSSSMRDRGRRG